MGCALLGLSAKEIERALPEIKDFSELGDFYYKPVKTYSSGMYVRLAFSVITMVDPELLIVDEALSVGDQHFQKKSLDRMQAFKKAGKTIVFCSHNLYQVKALCSKAIWLQNGKMVEFGEASEVVDNYQDAVRAENASAPGDVPETLKTQIADNRIVEVNLSGTKKQDIFISGGVLTVEVKVELLTVSYEHTHIGIMIMRNDDIHCYGVSTHIDQIALLHDHDNIYRVALTFEPLQLLSGRYYLCIYLLDEEGIHIYDHREQCSPFVVKSQSKEVGVAHLQHQWESC